MKVLLLCDYNPRQAAMVVDHINAFYIYSKHEIYIMSHLTSNNGDIPKFCLKLEDGESKNVMLDISIFDVLVVHYSLTLSLESYISEKTKRKIKDFNGLKVLFIQDEYRFVDRTIKSINELDIGIVYSCILENEIEKVYPASKLPNTKVIQTLTGFVPEGLKVFEPKPLIDRKVDVSYRGRKYPAWHGRQGLEKWVIADQFLKLIKPYKFKTNISYREKDRLYGLKWVELIRNSKAVLAVESGCSIFDMDGSISTRSESYNLLMKQSKNDTQPYEVMREKFFSGLEDQIDLAQISPRVFEAITLRTLVIAYEGEYSGVLKPWKHYVPLKKDHSNIEEIATLLHSPDKIAMIISDAYNDVAMNYEYSYKRFIEQFDIDVETAYLEKSQGTYRSTQRLNMSLEQTVGIYDIDEFYDAYPVYFVLNPHALDIPMVGDLAVKMKPYFPKRLIRFIKGIV